GEDHQLNPLLFARNHISPPLYRVVLQVLFALGLIIFGADIFVEEIKILATSWGIPPFILALIIAPIATELPEKFNSIIWIGQGKDTLALGNITGAMVFQSSIIPALGILLTDWSLTNLALLSAVLAIASASLVYCEIKVKKHLTPAMLMFGGMFYLVFIICVITGVVR
ncbi:MAG TPA: sodium:calcium antiporter, partial [Clostridia bacterium]|nr:sodium:calcium antiporter [Clostridia bacterium]